MTIKQYTLIVDGDKSFSISNDTDADPVSDYSPGIWGIKSQAKALEYAHRLISGGHQLTVTDYDNARYHTLANRFIRELGLKQPLFAETPEAPRNTATKPGIPHTFAELKRFFAVGTKVRVINYASQTTQTRDTTVARVQTNGIYTFRQSIQSWLEWGKATDWSLDDAGATHFWLDREGHLTHSCRLEYLPA